MPTSRREFLKSTGFVTGATLVGSPLFSASAGRAATDSGIRIEQVDTNFEREPLIRPFGFKGGYMAEVWQTVAGLRSAGGQRAVGLGTQNVLWSDAEVFSRHSENGGNALMYSITERAMQMIKGETFISPLALQEQILPEVYAYAQGISRQPDLRMTFALNALVAVDNALWLLYARERGITDFDALIPAAYQPALAHRHRKVASIPAVGYAAPMQELKDLARDGYFIMKIKIGAPGTQAEMLERDKERLTAIHHTIGGLRTEHTADGKIPYYFDANGRYEKKESLLRLLDHAKKIGAFEQIHVVEEPFAEQAEIDVHDIPARLAADESAHTDVDARRRIEMGYRAIALKPIAKTLSMTMKIAKVAHDKGVPCFCADLTVNPILVEWNKAIAARVTPLPGLNMGLQETNGHQNYRQWETMRAYHPQPEASWANAQNGVFELGPDYYQASGGIFQTPGHYPGLLRLD